MKKTLHLRIKPVISNWSVEYRVQVRMFWIFWRSIMDYSSLEEATKKVNEIMNLWEGSSIQYFIARKK